MAKRRPSGDGMVRKRDDGRWEGRIVVGHKENGEPIFQYALASTQKSLLAKLHQNIETFRDVELCEDCHMTLAEWLGRWLDEYAAPRLRESTIISYRMYAEQYIGPRLGGKKMNSITPADIQRMYTRLKKEGRVHEHPELGHELSAGTVRRVHTMLHRALGDAVQARIIPRNPAEGLTLPKADSAPRRVLTDKELDTFMEVIKTDPVWHDFFYTELTTGLRRGEVLALQWGDLNFCTGELRVERQVYRANGELAVTAPKTKAALRTIVLPPALVEALREYRQQVHSRWMFPSPIKEDSPLDPATVRKRLQTILEHAGCKKVRFHDLRHLFVTTSLESGMDVKTLSAIVGHVSAKTTLNTYTHVTEAMRRTAAAKIDRGIAGHGATPESENIPTQASKPAFQPYKGKIRKPGTGCVTQINDHLWEGRYSPKVNGKRMARNVYAQTEAECEEKLAALIVEMKKEIAALRGQERA